MRFLVRFFAYLCAIFAIFRIYSVPLSFLTLAPGNMRDIDWDLLQNPLFNIYFDHKAPNMSIYALQSLNTAYPYLSELLGVRMGNDSFPLTDTERKRTIISPFSSINVILGDRYNGAGFANPVMGSIEAQILQARQASFFQHELVHRLMYEHNDLHIGPLGRLFSVAMFPTWWIEGLAEYLTKSVGIEESNAILRQMALNNTWPSYDRLHALYNADGDTNLRGYVTSGFFMAWIFEHAKEKDLYKIHESIVKNTVHFPFYTAIDLWLNTQFEKTAELLYEDFKADIHLQVEKNLEDIPSLQKQNSVGITSLFPQDLVITNNGVIWSQLNKVSSPFPSALFTKEDSSSKSIRQTIPINGSSLLSMKETNSHLLWSSHWKGFANGSFASDLVRIHYEGDLINEHANNWQEKYFSISNEEDPKFIQQIMPINDDKLALITINFGDTLVEIFDTDSQKIQTLIKLPFPTTSKILSSHLMDHDNLCLNILIKKDFNISSIKQICENQSINKVLFPEKKLDIKDAIENIDGSFTLLSYWNHLQALFQYNNNNNILTPIAAFPDWVEKIYSWSNDGHFIGVSLYKKGEYELYKVDTINLSKDFKTWQTHQKLNQIFQEIPVFKEYQAPFISIYKDSIRNYAKNSSNEKIKDLSEVEQEEKILQSNTGATNLASAEVDIKQTENLVGSEAPYNSYFLFAYPYALPDFLGGPSLGLMAIPVIDSMERYRVVVFGGYNFFLQAPAGSITYENNRVLDHFGISLFSTPFFNGFYDTNYYHINTSGQLVFKNTERSYNYLNQTGISFSGEKIFRPTTLDLKTFLSIYHLAPYNNLDTAPTLIGAQTANILSIKSLLSFNLLDKAFYISEESQQNWLRSTTTLLLGAGTSHSFASTQDSAGNDTGILNYNNANAAINTLFTYNKHHLTLYAFISTTQGENTLNIQEVYSPYQSYILGNVSSLNYVSYPLVGSRTLFDLDSGLWSYTNNIIYDFPILSNFESRFLMAYIDDWRISFGLNEGGISNSQKFQNPTGTVSYSIGSSVVADIKGFQIYPSLIFSQIIGRSNDWAVLMQVKFMDFLSM